MHSLSNAALAKVSGQSNVLDFEIVEQLKKISSLSAARGYPVEPYTQKALSALADLPTEKKASLIERVQTTIDIVATGAEVEKSFPSEDHSEKRLVEQALNFYGYELKDEEFWTTIRKDELIEIYNSENIQIFRTFNFFRTSSYSLLDLLVNEWYHLWERPTGTLDNMFKVVSAIFSGEIKGITSAGVPEHIINEIFNAENKDQFVSRSSLCRFGVICPIYNKSDGQIGGLLVSAQVTPVALGEQASKISFI